MNLFQLPGTAKNRVQEAISAFSAGEGVLIIDDHGRENEADIVFSAEKMSIEQMAFTIRYGSGIICLCITNAHRKQLALPMMVPTNSSHYQTPFTVSIEAAKGVTTGVSAADRIMTIRTAIADDVQPADLLRPGHVFPLCAQDNGVLARQGHTEASIDLAKLAGLKPASVICEIMNDDGTMVKGAQFIDFADAHHLKIVMVADLIWYRLSAINEDKSV